MVIVPIQWPNRNVFYGNLDNTKGNGIGTKRTTHLRKHKQYARIKIVGFIRANNGEGGQAVGYVRLHIDVRRVDVLKGDGLYTRNHEELSY